MTFSSSWSRESPTNLQPTTRSINVCVCLDRKASFRPCRRPASPASPMTVIANTHVASILLEKLNKFARTPRKKPQRHIYCCRHPSNYRTVRLRPDWRGHNIQMISICSAFLFQAAQSLPFALKLFAKVSPSLQQGAAARLLSPNYRCLGISHPLKSSVVLIS